jgi:hypothetical protein
MILRHYAKKRCENVCTYVPEVFFQCVLVECALVVSDDFRCFVQLENLDMIDGVRRGEDVRG